MLTPKIKGVWSDRYPGQWKIEFGKRLRVRSQLDVGENLYEPGAKKFMTLPGRPYTLLGLPKEGTSTGKSILVRKVVHPKKYRGGEGNQREGSC